MHSVRRLWGLTGDDTPLLPTESLALRQGVAKAGHRILLVWPEVSDFDRITTLRNQLWTRTWFLDQRMHDIETNRNWLQSQSEHSDEALLMIKWSESGLFLGTIGWTDWDHLRHTACFGRLMVDRKALRELRSRSEREYVGVAIDAATAMRNYAFEVMRLQVGTTWYIQGNHSAARVNQAIGMVVTGQGTRRRPNGTVVETVELTITRQRWEELRAMK